MTTFGPLEWDKQGTEPFEVDFANQLLKSDGTYAQLSGTPTVTLQQRASWGPPESWTDRSSELTPGNITIGDGASTNTKVTFTLPVTAAAEPEVGEDYRLVIVADRNDTGQCVSKTLLHIRG